MVNVVEIDLVKSIFHEGRKLQLKYIIQRGFCEILRKSHNFPNIEISKDWKI